MCLLTFDHFLLKVLIFVFIEFNLEKKNIFNDTL